MKKLLSIIIALAMMLSLAACGSSTPAPEDTGGEQQNEQQGGTHQNGELTQTEKEKLVSTVLNLSAFGKDSEDNPYKWLVLDVDTENKKALLIMDGYIDTMYMFADDEVHTWENSQIREYLNFQPNMDVMFTAEEQEFILETAVSNPANPKTGVSSGKDTTDRLFLLSAQEMEKYFENPEDRVVYDAEGNPVGQYLRTAGGEESYFAMIIQDNSGEIDYNGSYGYSGAYAIRPAMWVDVSDAQVPAQSPETDKPHPQNVQLGTLQIFDKSAITALRIEGENSGVLNDRQLATTGIYSIFEHDEWIQFYPVGDAEEIDIYYLAHDEKADYSKVEAEWVYENGVFFTRLYNQKNESFPDGYWGATYVDRDMKTGYFDLVFTSGGKIVAVMTIQVFEEDGLQNYTDAELIALNDGKVAETSQGNQPQTDKEKLVSTVLNLSAFGKDSEGNPYKWQVLDVDDENEKALLVTKDIVALMAFAEGTETWEDSLVRQWLNNDFINEAFTDEEAAIILSTDITIAPNAEYGTSGGNSTTDKVFLLSEAEVNSYFIDGEARRSNYNGQLEDWWTITSGEDETSIIIVISEGTILTDGYMKRQEEGVRPAMWVDISGADLEDVQNTPAPENKPEENKPTPTPEKEDKPNNPPASVSGFVTTKTGKFYSVFTSGAIKMDYELVIDGQLTRMVTATKGDKAYMENYLNGEATGCSIIDGKDMYVIEHSSKLIIKMALKNDLMTVASKVITENDVDMTQLEKGSREIDGKKYDTESWVMDGDKVTMCFDGNKLAYIISDPGTGEAVIKILDYSADVDDSLFNIPSGYTVLDMSGN